MKVAIYARVSTNEQTTENQVRELTEWASRAGHKIVAIYDDNGVSGAKGREYRKEFDKLLRGAVRRESDPARPIADGYGLDDLVRLHIDHADAVAAFIGHEQASGGAGNRR